MADTSILFILYESAVGYGLFEVVSFDEIGSLLDSSNTTTTDIQRFGRAIKLNAFVPFTSAIEALENANAISEHAMTTTLYNFLELHLPKSKSSSKSSSKSTASYSLGVINPELANSIVEGFSAVSRTVVCRSDDTIREIIRGCRYHFDTYIKGLIHTPSTGSSEKASLPTTADTSMVTIKAQLGLGHSYSRSKVKFNPARSDNMIIQSIAILDQLDKDINTFAMRIREWYSWHFPELKEIVKDNIIFARTAAYIQDKSSLFTSSSSSPLTMNGDHSEDIIEEKLKQLGDIVGDVDTASLIVSAAKTSMGMDCSPIDMINIINFTQRMIKMAEYRKQLQYYLSDKMNMVAPNLSALIGDSVAARLISKAGSLTNLAKAPASTVQILGAEKALFRALKTKGNTPKYGLIYHSTFIGRADAKNKGRISRYLANKCSIATRIDSFADEPNRLYGEKLRDQVEERLKFYETGAAPRRNIDVMEEVSKELKAAAGLTASASTSARPMDIDDDDDDNDGPKSEKKKKKKDKKRKSVDEDDKNEKDKKGSKKAKRMSVENDDDGDEPIVKDRELSPKKSAKKEKKEKKSKKSM